jgi:glycosyltransferase involved in cell wall biosynthesis
MRILWNIHLYPPKHNCGSEMVAHGINKYLISKGHQVRVILQQYDGAMYNYEGVEVFPATGSLDAFRWAEVIMTHLDYSQFSILMAHSIQRPVVHFVHNNITYSSIKNASRGQFVVYNSEWCKDEINYPHPSVVVHPPCDIDHYAVNDEPGICPYITLISLNERKGGYMLYKIAKAMPERKFLAVVGSYDNPGPMKLSQEKIVEMLSTLPNVELVKNSPAITDTYKRTRLLIMPSDYESWGRTATEAMCNGIPVICTPTLGLLENCGDAAVYVGAPIEKPAPGEAAVTIGTAEQWITAIKKFDSVKYYREKSVLCTERARELDPRRELEALEQFIINARF